MTPLAPIVAVFGRTDAGLLAAQVGELGFLAAPHAAGLRILSCWRSRKPLSAWTIDDFSGADGIVPDEQAFRARVEDAAEHRRELQGLGRRSIACGIETPWGPSQHSEHYDDGIAFHATAGHGGFFLEPERNILVHAKLRNLAGWYEEDCEWAKVAFSFPSLFTTKERRSAAATLRNDEPDAWEAILGVVLLPGESCEKDRRRFYRDHRDRWIVISATRTEDDPTMVQCTASRGGVRTAGELRTYLVPHAEYAPGQFGFVIDESRHRTVDTGAANRA